MSLTSPYEPLRGLTIQRVASALSADRPKTPFFRGARPPLGVVCHPKRWKRLKVRIPPLSGPAAYLHGSGTFPGLSCRNSQGEDTMTRNRTARPAYKAATDAIAQSIRDCATVYIDHTPALAPAFDAIVEAEGGLALKNHPAGQLYAGAPGNGWRVVLRENEESDNARARVPVRWRARV